MVFVWLLLLAGLLRPAMAEQWTTTGSGFARGELDGMEVTPQGIVRLLSFSGANLVLGQPTSVDRKTQYALTDGDPATEWTFSDDPQVLGHIIELELRGTRLIDRVHIVPGTDTAVQEPEFFLKGYRIEAAPENANDNWQVVAESSINKHQIIDTTADSTWKRFDARGPVPVLARYLRLTVIRQDLPNRVSIGEIEVYGTGYQISGQYLSPVRDFRVPVDLGMLSWKGTAPAGTRWDLRVRTSQDNVTWPSWDEVPIYDSTKNSLAYTVEPTRYVQFRAQAHTDDPLVTPTLEQIILDYDPHLVAHAAQGVVRPRQAVLGVPVTLSYLVAVEVSPQDRGVDRLALDQWGQVEELRINGASVPAEGYTVETLTPGSAQVPALALRLAPQYRLSNSSQVELRFTTTFLTETTAIRMFLGTVQGQAAQWQRVSVLDPDSALVEVSGVLDHLVPLASVRLVPPVVRPGREAQVRFDLGRIQEPVPVEVAIFDLSGRCVRRLLEDELLHAGPIAIPWDGCDGAGRALVPGIYVYRIAVYAQQSQVITRTLGVAY